eukprot:2677155-Prymnesium_polylepis.1
MVCNVCHVGDADRWLKQAESRCEVGQPRILALDRDVEHPIARDRREDRRNQPQHCAREQACGVGALGWPAEGVCAAQQHS